MAFDGKALALAIDAYCKNNNISKKQFHKDTGISSATLSQWRKGKFTPSKQNIKQLEAYFGISIEDFMAGNYQEKKPVQMDELEYLYLLREDLRDNPGFRMLYNETDGATVADMLEAAAVLARRKEERQGR